MGVDAIIGILTVLGGAALTAWLLWIESKKDKAKKEKIESFLTKDAMWEYRMFNDNPYDDFVVYRVRIMSVKKNRRGQVWVQFENLLKGRVEECSKERFLYNYTPEAIESTEAVYQRV